MFKCLTVRIGSPTLYKTHLIRGQTMADIPFLGGNFKTNYLMKTIHLFFTLLLVSFQAINAQDKALTIDHTQEHIQFLEDFYAEYLSGPDVPNPEKRIRVRKKYCSSNLVDKINEMKKNRRLSYDPFINAQDYPPTILNHIKIEKQEEEKNVYMMSYPHDFHVEVELTQIKLEVINTVDGCKIAAVGKIKG